jgi:diguanylate cyclase (GGDEF)-like protein
MHRKGHEDDLYATAMARTAAVALFSTAALLMPRTRPVRWWALFAAVVLAAGAACIVAMSRRYRLHRDWPGWVQVLHLAVAQTAAGFAGVAVGGVEGNQRFLPMLILVVVASYSSPPIVAAGWLIATATVFWSSSASGTGTEVAFTVTAMFGASAAAIASIVHLLLSRIRRQNRHAGDTAALAAAIARADSLEHDLPEILAFTSRVFGGPALTLTRIGPDRSVTALGSHTPVARRRGVAQRSRRSDRGEAFAEEVLIAATSAGPHVLFIHWRTNAERRAVPAQSVGMVRDLLSHLVERSELIADLEHRTRTDPLTGLGNRRALASWLRLRNGVATVVILDLDHFKRFNDEYGHVAGDHLLRRFGATLRRHLRRGDCAVRLGGEEFCVALASLQSDVAEAFIARLRDALAMDPSGVTFSAGVAVAVHGETADEVLARADAALYEAKRGGRNRTVLAVAVDH